MLAREIRVAVPKPFARLLGQLMRQAIERAGVHHLAARHRDHGVAQRDQRAAPSRVAVLPIGVDVVPRAIVLDAQLRLRPAKIAYAVRAIGQAF